MPLTRASRKRLSAGDCSNAIIEAEVSEPSLLPPRTKRLRTASTSSSVTKAAPIASVAAAIHRKGRALKAVPTNAIPNSIQNANIIEQRQQQQELTAKRITRGAKTTTAASKPKAAAANKRGRPAKTAKQQATKEEEDQEQHFVSVETKTSSTRATFADGDDDDDDTKTETVSVAAAEVAAVAANTDQNNNNSNANIAVNTEHLDIRDSLRNEAGEIATSSSSYQNGVPDDIDARDARDPLSVTDYVADMYKHFRSKEEECSVDSMYMGSKQPNINESMRCILVDWLIEVHYKFKLFPETLYLTVNVLDRFLAQTPDEVTKRDLQLVGVTALLVSAKYEEMYVPELRDLTYICDGAYTETKILRMEEKMLKTLNYNVTVPTPHTFLIRFLKAAHADKLMAQLACFLLDGTLLSLESLTCRWRPSQLAAAAILLARRQCGRHNWSPTLVTYSLYREEDVLPVAKALLHNKHRLEQNRELLALAKKYSKNKYGKVSHFKFDPLEYPEAVSGDESIEGIEDSHVSL